MEEKLPENSGVERTDADNNLNFKWFFSTLLAVWPWFLISVIVSVSVAHLYLRYITPIYKISAEVSILDNSRGRSAESSILEGLGMSSGKSNMENEIRFLRSRTMITRVVKDLELNVRYFFSGRVKTAELYTEAPFKFNIIPAEDTIKDYFSYKLTTKDDKTFTISEGKTNYTGKWGDTIACRIGKVAVERKPEFELIKEEVYTVSIAPVSKSIGKFSALEITLPSKQSNSITISILDELPRRGEAFIDRLIQTYMSENVNERNRIANNTISFIDDRLALVGSELMGIEKDIETFKRNNELTDVQAQAALLLQNSNVFEKDLVDASMELNMVNLIEESLLQNKRTPGSIVLPSNPSVSRYLDRFNSLIAERNRLLLTSTESNPIVLNLDKELSLTKESLRSTIAGAKSDLQLKVAMLKKQAGNYGSEIQKVPSKERVFLDYSRQQAIKQELYVYLLTKREETAISKSATIANSRIIDPALATDWPILPNRSRILTIAFICGLLVPTLILYLRRLMNTRIISKVDIIKQTSIPILSEIGHYAEEHSIAVKDNSRSVLAEQFRALRTNLQFLLTNKSDKVILLTSSMSGEGKSFIAINLASTFAISGKKVVLMELDLRKPKISSNLGINNSVGFSNYAIGNATMDDIIVPSGIVDNLFVIPSGPVPPNPVELLMLPKIETFFEILREQFDYIVIDTAPLGLVTDAQILSKFSDASLYVVRQAYTYKQQIQIPNDLYVKNKMQKLSIIVNDVKLNRGFEYGYGYGYGYGGYGYGGYGYSSYGYGHGDNGNGYFQEEKQSGIAKILKKIKK